MGKCTTPTCTTHWEWVECPQCKKLSRGTVWHRRPRVYEFRCDHCFHRLRNENGVRPWVVPSAPKFNDIPF